MKFSLGLTSITGVAIVVIATHSATAAADAADKNLFLSKLLRNARPTSNSQLDHSNSRRMDQGVSPDLDWISKYSIRFEKCQSIDDYRDFTTVQQQQQQQDAEPIVAVARSKPIVPQIGVPNQDVVVFRLCPSSYGKCDGSCDSNFGEYVISLEEYLDATLSYQRVLQNVKCDAFFEKCTYERLCDDDCDDEVYAVYEEFIYENENDNGSIMESNQCDIEHECWISATAEENGYVDVSNFISCQKIYSYSESFAGPVCTNNGSKISIGVFADEDCSVPDLNSEFEYMTGDNALGHALVKATYDSETCMSCATSDGMGMCAWLYDFSVKCETTHGMEDGPDDELGQERLVCDFLDALLVNTGSDSDNDKENADDEEEEYPPMQSPTTSVPLRSSAFGGLLRLSSKIGIFFSFFVVFGS